MAKRTCETAGNRAGDVWDEVGQQWVSRETMESIDRSKHHLGSMHAGSLQDCELCGASRDLEVV